MHYWDLAKEKKILLSKWLLIIKNVFFMDQAHLLSKDNCHAISIVKNRKLSLLLIVLSAFAFAGNISGQDLHSALQVRNSHLWRGIEVNSGLTFTGDLHLDEEYLYGGFWGGGNAEGSYKEFNNYIGFRKGRLNIELWDIYNFSPAATYNNEEFFNYNAGETGRFLDFRSNFLLSKKVPLLLSWNAVLFGRDRNEGNTENKYSYFASVQYPFYSKADLEVNGRIGYASALNKAGELNNFFSGKSGINEVSIMVSKDLSIVGYKLPVGIWAMWNPVDNHGYLQFAAQVYSF